jgi:hypothetical protein
MAVVSFDVDPCQSVADPDGASWTVAVVRANQWQRWRWLRWVEVVFDGYNVVGALLIAIVVFAVPAVVAMGLRWFAYHLLYRTDKRVTVREGVHHQGSARRDAVLDEIHPNAQQAHDRARALSDEIRAGRWTGCDFGPTKAR